VELRVAVSWTLDEHSPSFEGDTIPLNDKKMNLILSCRYQTKSRTPSQYGEHGTYEINTRKGWYFPPFCSASEIAMKHF